MNVIWYPAVLFGFPNQGDSGREGHSIKGIVCHTMAGWWNFYQRIITNRAPGFRNSAHYSINRDGTIHQHVKEEDSSWCNGPMAAPDLSVPWIKECWERKINPNLVTITIEMEGLSGEPLTEVQYQAMHWLIEDILRRHPEIPKDRTGIVGHYQIDGVNKQGCPGKAFPWARLMNDIKPTVDPRLLLVGEGLRAWFVAHPEVGRPRFQSFFEHENEHVWCEPTTEYPDGPLVSWRHWISDRGGDPVKVTTWKDRL